MTRDAAAALTLAIVAVTLFVLFKLCALALATIFTAAAVVIA